MHPCINVEDSVLVVPCLKFFSMKINNSSIQETTAPVSVYITYSVIVPILCIIGIVGNSLSIIILSRKSLKKSIIYAYLKGK